MITPSLPDHLERAAAGRRVPLRCRISADLETPVSAFLKLKPRGAVFLLESVERGIQVGRYSFIGVAPYARVRLQDEKVTIERDGVTDGAAGRPAGSLRRGARGVEEPYRSACPRTRRFSSRCPGPSRRRSATSPTT